MVNNTNQADIKTFIGSTGSGKSTALQKAVKAKRADRILVWDYKDEYGSGDAVRALGHFQQAMTLGDILKLARTGSGSTRKKFRIRFVPGHRHKREDLEKAFSAICSIAMSLKNVCLIGEELHFVTRPNGGPPGYQEAISVGRARDGISIYGSSQRPARVDKDIFSNSTMIWCGRLGWGEDSNIMSKALDVPVDEIRNLKGHESIARDKLTGDLLRNGAKVKKI